MKHNITLIILAIFVQSLACRITAQSEFETYFSPQTMRIDYFHSGTATEEHFAIDHILNDGAWAGSKKHLIDELERGFYFYEITDPESGKLIYSRGFASIFGEWQSIPEAKEKWGTFHESIRIPWPKKPVRVTMKKRNAQNAFEAIWKTEIDPASRGVNPSEQLHPYHSWAYMENGSPNEKVDIVILGDGYTASEMEKFHSDMARMAENLLSTEPFKSRRDDFNIWAVETPSLISGVNRPHPGVFKRTPLSVSYSAFDSERYALSYDNRTIRDVASSVPYEFMIILINEQTYGGGGIYRLYATAAVDNKFSDYIVVHEFGHHIAALADEYYTSAVAYEAGEITVEPWEPNITALLDPENLKWKDLVEPGTPIPTPWDKETYDNYSYGIQKERTKLRQEKAPESVVEDLFLRERKEETAMLEGMEYFGKVGAYEGAGYMQYGMYRPYLDCIMFSRNKNVFCPVCRKAIERVIEQYVE